MAAAKKALETPVSTITAQALGLAITKSQAVLNKGQAPVKRVSVMRDHMLEYPELWLDVYVAGNVYEERQFAEMFSRAKCKRATDPNRADLVVFTGGPDVNPALYNEKPHPSTKVDRQRDIDDLKLFAHCRDHGIPMFGVCRGAQFGSVMHGGKLWQDVDGHYGDHGIYDVKSGLVIPRVSSIHHQMVMDNTENGMEILATTSRSENRWANDIECDVGKRKDIEAFFYRDSAFLGVQGHPEYRGYYQFAQWTLTLIRDYIVCNPDLEWRESQYRIKEDLVQQRLAGWEEKVKKNNIPHPQALKGAN